MSNTNNKNKQLKQFNVEGMSCAACSARIEKAVSKVPGVTSCSVSLLTNSMGVEGDVSEKDIIAAVTKAGYGASPKGGAHVVGKQADRITDEGNMQESFAETAYDDEILKDRETPVLKKRLIRSLIVMAVLMYFSMGHMMWGFPAPKAFDNLVFLGTFEMLLAIIVMAINSKFFTSGFRSLLMGTPNMDTLVALGSTASFGYSLAELFIMILAQGSGDHDTVMQYGMNLYFESAAMIPTLITIGKLLEAISKGRTTDALKGLMKLAPKTALIEVDGEERLVNITEVKVGDVFIVKPGDSIPVDGRIIEGNTSINEAALTGESLPADKEVGDFVSAATINQEGYIRCSAVRVGEDTTLAQIIRTVSDAAATKAPLARIADKVSGIFVPAVIVIALITMGGWMLAGKSLGFAIARAISVLVISCPCALGLATPVAIMVGSGVGAKNGILYKTAASLESLGRTKVIALDKTGTITKGEPKVTDIIPLGVEDETALIKLAYLLEKKSEHPLAKAVVAMAEERFSQEELNIGDVADFAALPGNGLKGRFINKGYEIFAGSYKFISSITEISSNTTTLIESLADEGKTPLIFAVGDKLAGIIAVADTIKEDSALAISELKAMGIHTVMLTGDNEKTANAIGRLAGVDEVVAGVLPDEKADVIKRLKESGKTAMVGDGINDAPALTVADTGIAIGAGSDIALDAADVVIMKSRLTDLSAAVRLSKATIRNIHENLFWAFIYNVICIPLAIGLLGVAMKPVYGAMAMSISSFSVCMNALRLNFVKLFDSSRDRRIEQKIIDKKEIKEKNETEEKQMEKTLNVEGMMCGHCEAAVKKALEAIDGVETASADHNEAVAKVVLSKEVDNEILKKAVEALEYTVKGIE